MLSPEQQQQIVSILTRCDTAEKQKDCLRELSFLHIDTTEFIKSVVEYVDCNYRCEDAEEYKKALAEIQDTVA